MYSAVYGRYSFFCPAKVRRLSGPSAAQHAQIMAKAVYITVVGVKKYVTAPHTS